VEVFLVVAGITLSVITYSFGHRRGQLDAQAQLDRLIQNGNLKEVTRLPIDSARK